MQEQEIIIDGVNVLPCKYFHKIMSLTTCEVYNACEAFEKPCSNCSDCVFKKWKKAEQENQDLRDNYVKLDLQRVDDINSLVKANELLFQMAILAQQEYKDLNCYSTLKFEWFQHLQNIKTLREYKSNVMDRIKNYKKVAHDIDKEIEKRLKNGEVEE